MQPKKMMRIAVVGLGRRSCRYAIPFLRQNRDRWRLTALCDSSELAIEKFRENFPELENIPSYHDISSMNSSEDLDCAYIAVPHHQGASTVSRLLSSKIHCLKEKPAAMNVQELEYLQKLAKSQAVTFSTASQFRYSSQSQQMREWLPSIGRVSHAEALWKISVKDLGAGWRASRALAGGGVVIDLGWHLLDLVLQLLGDGSIPEIEIASILQARPSQVYDCEDSAMAILNIHNRNIGIGNGFIPCSISVTRLGPSETCQLTIYGEHGSLQLENDVVRLSLAENTESRKFETRLLPFQHMMQRFFDTVIESRFVNDDYAADFITTQAVDKIYASAKILRNENKPNPTLQPETGIDCSFTWPVISGEVTSAVNRQLQKSISIYNDGGIFGEFERAWKTFHDQGDSFALLHNSGTNALQALYFAADLRPGDEVIFPVYSFHATSSPAMHFGIVPVFCDASYDGNISAESILAAITPRTRVIVVTHMWGMPGNMESICEVLQNHPDILLFEDCSHAHGAKIGRRRVGTFGDAAAWSIQGQKIISGGEGGITLTRKADLHYRQLLWGHYNKRCKAEIPKNHRLRPYSLTGAGSKNRAHPLAVAVASTQLQHLDSIQRFKSMYASQIVSGLTKVPFLKSPDLVSIGRAQVQPAWYAFILRFISSCAPPGLTRDSFVHKLHECGLCEVDIPKSTGLLHREPLFTSPQDILPHLYTNDFPRTRNDKDFPEAQAFYDEAIKLPVWASPSDQAVVTHYINTIAEVAAQFGE